MSTPEELTAEVGQLIEEGKYRAAAEACDRLNQQFPEYEFGWYTSSRLGLIVREPVLALKAIDRALQLSPEKPEWLFQKLRCLGAAGNQREAREIAVALASLKLTTTDASAELAMMLSRLGLHELAVQHYRRAAELGSENPDHYLNLAAAERTLGNVDGALDALDKGLELQPDDAGALYLRSTLRKQTSDENHVAELEAAVERATDRPDDKIRLHYALTKEYEDLERYATAFEHLIKGSKLMRSRLNFSLQQELDTMRTVRDMLTAEKAENAVPGHVNADPIFVVGMPRTGTALVDQILRAHPVVQPVGSSQAFMESLTSESVKSGAEPPKSIAELVSRAVEVDFERVGENYILTARPMANDMAHFVDSMPMNFLYAGFIHLALPKAKIIVLEREPMDTCFFAFRTLFEGAYPFSYDLDEIADFYLGYTAQMAHWREIMPGVMHTVQYEELVTNPRPVIEDLLQHCGLSFDPACLGFWDDEKMLIRGEQQPSRQDMFRGSIGMWKHYERELAGLWEKIGA